MTPFDLARFGGEPERPRCNAEQIRRLVQIKPWLVPIWRRPKDRDLMMRVDNFRRAAIYADRILKGEKQGPQHSLVGPQIGQDARATARWELQCGANSGSALHRAIPRPVTCAFVADGACQWPR